MTHRIDSSSAKDAPLTHYIGMFIGPHSSGAKTYVLALLSCTLKAQTALTLA